VSLERIAFLGDSVIDPGVLREPTRAQDRVVKVGRLDDPGRVPVGVKEGVAFLARYFVVRPRCYGFR
jgi:hypothetical protein